MAEHGQAHAHEGDAEHELLVPVFGLCAHEDVGACVGGTDEARGDETEHWNQLRKRRSNHVLRIVLAEIPSFVPERIPKTVFLHNVAASYQGHETKDCDSISRELFALTFCLICYTHLPPICSN